MAKKFIRNRFTWVAYLLLALYAYFLNIPGAITPFLRDEFHLSYTVSSLHFSAFAVGILVVGLAGHAIIRRIGRVQTLSVGATGAGVGALLLAFGRSPAITIGASFLMGCIGSLILAVVPTALSDEHGEMRAVAISEANVLSSLVSAMAPVFVGLLVTLQFSWRWALISAALLSVLIGAVLFRRGRPQATQIDPDLPRRGLPSLYWVYWITLVLAVAIEFCMIYWTAAYMEKELNMPRASAAQAVSLFLAGMILGRLMSSRMLRYFSARLVVFASILLGMAGFALYWSTTNALVGMISVAITGLGVASLYPLILSMAIGAVKGNEAQAGARATLASGVAILVLPLVLGRLADMIGLKSAFAVIAVMLVAVFLLMALIGKLQQHAIAATEKQKEFSEQT
jgi:fucose permease